MNKLKYILFLAAGSVLLTGCFDDPGTDITFEGNIISLSTSSANVDEGASGSVLVELAKASTTDVTINYTITATNAINGVDFNISGTSLTIPAGEYSAELAYDVPQNESVDPSRSVTIEITDVSGTDADIDGNTSFVITLVDDDFFCTRNTISKWVTTELDEGFDTCSASVGIVTEPGPECLSFRIVSGAGSLFGCFANISYVVDLEEDSPESSTGSVVDTDIFNLQSADGGSSYSNQLKITGGSYDLDAQSLRVDYEYYGTDGVFRYSGTFVYE